MELWSCEVNGGIRTLEVRRNVVKPSSATSTDN